MLSYWFFPFGNIKCLNLIKITCLSTRVQSPAAHAGAQKGAINTLSTDEERQLMEASALAVNTRLMGFHPRILGMPSSCRQSCKHLMLRGEPHGYEQPFQRLRLDKDCWGGIEHKVTQNPQAQCFSSVISKLIYFLSLIPSQLGLL